MREQIESKLTGDGKAWKGIWCKVTKAKSRPLTCESGWSVDLLSFRNLTFVQKLIWIFKIQSFVISTLFLLQLEFMLRCHDSQTTTQLRGHCGCSFVLFLFKLRWTVKTRLLFNSDSLLQAVTDVATERFRCACFCRKQQQNGHRY